MKKFFAVFAIAFCALTSFTACSEKDNDGVNEEQGTATLASKYDEGITETDNQVAMKAEVNGAVTFYLFDFDADGICTGGILEVTASGYTTKSEYTSCNGLTKAEVVYIITAVYNQLTGKA